MSLRSWGTSRLPVDLLVKGKHEITQRTVNPGKCLYTKLGSLMCSSIPLHYRALGWSWQLIYNCLGGSSSQLKGLCGL